MTIFDAKDMLPNALEALSSFVGFARKANDPAEDPMPVDRPYEFADRDHNSGFALLV